MSELFRFGVSVEKKLLEKFDQVIQEENYSNRSEAIRDLMRDKFVQKQWKGNETVAGAVSMVYDHHKRELLSHLTDIQHDYQELIVCTQHIHLDHSNCMEILAVRGKAKSIENLTNTLKAVKGVKHCSLSMTTLGAKNC